MKQKKIYLNTNKTKYCIVKLFDSAKQLRRYYKIKCPKDGNHESVKGVSLHYEKFKVEADGRMLLSNETGTVLLSKEHAEIGIITHELFHAVLYAYKHRAYKKQYPIVIKNMQEEEIILHNHTFAVNQFYDWYTNLTKSKCNGMAQSG